MSVAEGSDPLHRSVLLNECLQYLRPVSGGVYVDGTLGLGGHSAAILERSAPDGRVIAFEWDEEALRWSRQRLQAYGDRLTIVRRNFAELVEGLGELGIDRIDGLLLDVGVSSLQLDQEGRRGFSFQRDEPLDMRMDNRRPLTAGRLLATCSEEELADIFYYYGEERQARPIAAAIVESRRREEIVTTKQLVAVVVRAVPRRFHPKHIHVATKVFQALRIAVNGELENLARVIDDGAAFLKPEGRLAVISFHSLEDRIVKRKFLADPRLAVVTKKSVVASREETELNPRARSARLRVAERQS